MIIGISGRMGAGKDTLGMVLQALTMEGAFGGRSRWAENPLEYVTAYQGTPNLKGGWKIVKFADKLKEIASMLTGIPRAAFESQEVKDRILPVEWNSWRVYFVQDHTLNHDEQYGPDFVTHNEAIMWEASERRALNWPPRLKTDIREHQMTVREFLQKLGTEGLRTGLHKNIWVNALFADYKLWKPKMDMEPVLPSWIITDMRFPNEAQAVKDRGGITVRIDRPGNPTKVNGHASESALDDWNFDIRVVNNGKLDESFTHCAETILHKAAKYESITDK